MYESAPCTYYSLGLVLQIVERQIKYRVERLNFLIVFRYMYCVRAVALQNGDIVSKCENRMVFFFTFSYGTCNTSERAGTKVYSWQCARNGSQHDTMKRTTHRNAKYVCE